ncbi:GYDIA family GHMP kinase [Leeuwenhoekiella sp. MAR_2009_132]|uniref:GYDIA family GHMP kinase n=1 Tax=Leeuwenhoekiella sp. MAR_2009_132 TaxID=1392489 RepID=UPI00048AB774|nr:GYDIA family GHMP kinase [Leeuwenhoekiella sp. MAR_2009_132]
MSKRFYGHGKLLITGEYLVLDGALALAIPTQKGQSLVVEDLNTEGITWVSLKSSGELWFTTHLTYEDLNKSLPEQPADPKDRLIQLLAAARSLNPQFLRDAKNIKVTTTLEFESNWGLGSSSTLIYTLAEWAEVDAYALLNLTFGGSGYDIACASNHTPILYQLKEQKPRVLQTQFNPPFRDQLYFIHLNKKQNSRDAISNYRKQPKESLESAINKVSGISETLLICEELLSFRALIDAHERIIASVLNTQTIKQQLFADYPGSIKSLGGWGGDFILVTANQEDLDYFRNKEYHTIISYSDMAY